MNDDLKQTLINAIQAMLVGTDENSPEAFPGHTKAFLDAVAKPRAREALRKAGVKEKDIN